MELGGRGILGLFDNFRTVNGTFVSLNDLLESIRSMDYLWLMDCIVLNTIMCLEYHWIRLVFTLHLKKKLLNLINHKILFLAFYFY